MIHIVTLLGAALLLWLLWDRFGRRRGIPLTRVMTSVALAGLAALGILLLVSGKIAGLLAVLAGLWPWIARAMRLHSAWQWLRGFRQAPPSPSGKAGPQDRVHQSAPPPPPSAKGMGLAEACDILGVPQTASVEEIRAAHRRLMLANHPDHGGSTWIASRINQARDVLLAKRG